MTTNSMTSEPVVRMAPTSLPAWMKRHPLASYFAMAYGFAWLLWVPLLMLSQDGLGVLPFTAPAIPLVILGGFAPGAAAILVTALVDGKAGVARLLRRCLQWRVGIRWYLVAFLIPILFLVTSILLGALQPQALLQKWPLLLTFYPLDLVIQTVVAGGLGEEPGWRGFALPRLQSAFGPLPAALFVGVLHACWHIPLFFVRVLSQSHFNFLLYLLTAVGVSVLLTWIYNNTGGALLILMVLHEAQDTTSSLSLRIAPAYLDRTLAYAVVYGVIALVILISTRGFLSYRPGGPGGHPD